MRTKTRQRRMDFHKKPASHQRSVEDALHRAEQIRADLPKTVQVHASDWDLVILADAYADAYGRGVSAGKQEALRYTPEERERYGRWVAQAQSVPNGNEKLLAAQGNPNSPFSDPPEYHESFA